jgi:hypothetical protein
MPIYHGVGDTQVHMGNELLLKQLLVSQHLQKKEQAED